jgi:ATP-dependent protease ClpP protease subunit
MIKKCIILLSLALFSHDAYGISLLDKRSNTEIKSDRVVSIRDSIDDQTALKFELEILAGTSKPGDLIVLINSPGGLVTAGKRIIVAIETEKRNGHKVICVVTRHASSMAFNILTHCDSRLALPKSIFMFHPVAVQLPRGMDRLTPKVLRELLSEIEKDEEEFRSANIKALNMSPEDYDTFANEETLWRAETLLSRKYLHGIVIITAQ